MKTAEKETITDKTHFAVSALSWCWMEGGRVHWTASYFDGHNTWRAGFPLPHGISAGDVKAIIPDKLSVTLFTRDAAYRLDCDAARWSAPVALFDDGRPR